MDFLMMLVSAVLFISYLNQISAKTVLDPLSGSCLPSSKLLNDCNWCTCDGSGRYQCAARPCNSIDMFGHFKDAIAEIDVGMEGKGSWRSNPVACTPNTHYARNGLLCICNESGEWPNPVCRDVFRILYSVQPTGLTAVTENQTCSHNKLYLVGCNVCLCSQSGHLDNNLCTNIECQPDDPLVKAENNANVPKLPSSSKDEEIYATCDINEEYLLGCRKCVCLRNNRLMCKNCTEIADKQNSYCDGKKVNEIFNIDCNYCHCDDKKNMFCTAKKCLHDNSKGVNKKSIKRSSVNNSTKIKCTIREYGPVECMSCECVDDGTGRFDVVCNKKCDKNFSIHNGCVHDTAYEKDCLLCFCYSTKFDGLEICNRNPICDAEEEDGEGDPKPQINLRTTHGGCEPFHSYRKDCNVCQCLLDGKTLKCTSNQCDAPNTTVQMVPVIVREGDACPVGRMYYQQCNICVCQEDNKSICTTLSCNRRRKS